MLKVRQVLLDCYAPQAPLATPESNMAPPAIMELRIKSLRDKSCLLFMVSSVIQFDHTCFLQPRDDSFISRVICSATNLHAFQNGRLRTKRTDKPIACFGRTGSACTERHDGFFSKVMCCQKRADGRCGCFHPNRITDKYHVI